MAAGSSPATPTMKVLIACECWGTVRDAFIARGHDAISCDLKPTRVPGPHYIGDVFELLNTERFDLMIGHPPCTDICVSGALHFVEKKINGRQHSGLKFFLNLLTVNVPRICVENPVGVFSTKHVKASQYIQPWQFGHPVNKKNRSMA
jgi:site-specific DNA-cytosine methylase